MSPTIHLVYPHGPRIATPDVIGRRVGEHLAKSHDVVLHDWDELAVVVPGPGDVLLGHPHPLPGTVFRRSFRRRGWHRRIVLSPYTDDVRQVAFLDPFVRAADAYLAITGRWWARELTSSRFAHWAPRTVHVDLAVDRTDFPQVKREFAPAGRRRLLYIGHTGWYKNVGYLSQIARACPDWDFGWIGRGAATDVPGVTHHGVRDISDPATQDLIASYDFSITVGRADANPTTVLETMAWGLVPFCTPQSGYVDEPAVVNVPLDDVPGVVAVLRDWQEAPERRLREAQETGMRRLAEHYSWERFVRQVEAALAVVLPPTTSVPVRDRLRLAAHAAISPYGPLGPAGRRLAVAAGRRRLARIARG